MAPSPSARSPQAIQSRDRIQLQYSQSLIEKDQYRKQVRGLEAERDELLTTLTSLEGSKALLEAQLQRVQGGPCLKVSRVRSTSVLVGMPGSWEELWTGVGNMQDLVGYLAWGWECGGSGRSSWLGEGTCRTGWEPLAGGGIRGPFGNP